MAASELLLLLVCLIETKKKSVNENKQLVSLNSQNFHNSFFFGNFTTRLKRNSEIRNTKFSENWPFNFWPSNVTYTAVSLVGHDLEINVFVKYPCLRAK